MSNMNTSTKMTPDQIKTVAEITGKEIWEIELLEKVKEFYFANLINWNLECNNGNYALGFSIMTDLYSFINKCIEEDRDARH